MTPAGCARRRTLRAEREFGVLVGGILAALGGWWLFRGKLGSVAPVALSIGAALVLLGAAAPRALTMPYRLWMGAAERISRVVTLVVLSIVWLLVLTPIGLVKRAFGWDPLERRAAPSESYWRPYPERPRDHYGKMY